MDELDRDVDHREVDLGAWQVETLAPDFADRVLARLREVGRKGEFEDALDDALDDELQAMAEAVLIEDARAAAIPIARRRGARDVPRRGPTVLVAAVAALAAAAAVLLVLRPRQSRPVAPLPVAAPAATPAPAPSLDPPSDAAELDREAIRRAVAEQFVPKARTCYNALRRRTPSAEGRVTLRFGVVARDGRGIVDRVEVDEDSEIRDGVFHQCLVDAMLTVVFEPPSTDGRVQIVYPIVFQRPGTEGADGSTTVIDGGAR